MAKRKVEDVLIEYHKRVPFPMTVKKIKKAGYNVTEYLLELTNAIEACEDIDEPQCVHFIQAINEVRQLANLDTES